MYLPRAYAESDLAALDDLIARDNFITLITVRDGIPVTSHLPVLYRRDGHEVELRGHWARPNPQSRHAGRALAIVHAHMPTFHRRGTPTRKQPPGYRPGITRWQTSTAN